jgi:predicted small lipoprotein YifL
MVLHVQRTSNVIAMRAKTLWVPIAALLLSLAACGVPIRSGAYFSQNAEVSPPLSFAWSQAQDRATGDPRLENNQFFEDRLHEAIEWQLAMRGVRRADETPDLLIHHHLSLADHTMIEETIDESGLRREDVYTYEEGTVVVHVVDARSGQDVWVAWAQANIEPAMQGPDQMRTWVYDLVKEMFKGWPVTQRR